VQETGLNFRFEQRSTAESTGFGDTGRRVELKGKIKAAWWRDIRDDARRHGRADCSDICTEGVGGLGHIEGFSGYPMVDAGDQRGRGTGRTDIRDRRPFPEQTEREGGKGRGRQSETWLAGVWGALRRGRSSNGAERPRSSRRGSATPEVPYAAVPEVTARPGQKKWTGPCSRPPGKTGRTPRVKTACLFPRSRRAHETTRPGRTFGGDGPGDLRNYGTWWNREE